MKRKLGLMAANWLKKPENQEKVKRTAQDVLNRAQQALDSSGSSSSGTDRDDRNDRDNRQPANTKRSR